MPLSLFVVKLIISFIIGGLFIALLTILAERYPKASGTILSVPSTLMLGLFFIGWAHGIPAAQQAATVVPLAIALVILFALVFSFIAQVPFSHKATSMAFTNVIALLVWGVAAFFITSKHFESIYAPLFIYGCVALVAAYVARRASKYLVAPLKKEIHFTGLEIGLRAILAGTVIALSVLLAKVLSPLWGGMFANFPAAMLSSFNILYYRNDRKLLLITARTIPIASVYFVLYGFIVTWLFAPLGILVGTIIAEFIIVTLMMVVYRQTLTKRTE